MSPFDANFKNPTSIPQKIGEVGLKDFSDYKFRCHSLGDLIGGYLSERDKPALTDKQEETYREYLVKDKLTKLQAEKLAEFDAKIKAKENPIVELTQASKTVLHNIWNYEILKIRPVLKSKAVRRGKAQEDESMDLVNQVFKIELSKNTKRLENDYFTGEPDLLTQESVIDIKTCETWQTFQAKTSEVANTDHFYQVWAYLLLANKKRGYIAYTLPSYDESFILYKQEQAIDQEEADQEFYNMNFDRIPANKRIKVFKIQQRDIELPVVYEYLNKCREYLNNLNIHFANQQPLE